MKSKAYAFAYVSQARLFWLAIWLAILRFFQACGPASPFLNYAPQYSLEGYFTAHAFSIIAINPS